MLHKVILRGELRPHGDPIDKYVGRERKVLATINAEDLLRQFARECALSVIHLWNPPQVVVEYLKTGNKELRDAAWDAARDVARAAARDVARDAARDAAWDAARAAAWAVTWADAWGGARDAQRVLFVKMVNEAFK